MLSEDGVIVLRNIYNPRRKNKIYRKKDKEIFTTVKPVDLENTLISSVSKNMATNVITCRVYLLNRVLRQRSMVSFEANSKLANSKLS